MAAVKISDAVLMSVEKPARYIGNEINSVIKDKNNIDIRFCMCFPDVYEVGMSHLGIQILYDMFNSREDTWCERVYSPWPDMDAKMRELNIPLFALESKDPIKEFDFLGITLQYEMCYSNVLQVLDLSGIPLHSKDRGEDCPIVIGGGPCVYNPEPIAEFFDIFYIGEGETVYNELLDAYKDNRKNGGTRLDFLRRAAGIEGLYIPSFYHPEYNEDGTMSAFVIDDPAAGEHIKRQVQWDLDNTYYPKKPLVPYIRAVQDRATLEILRGCIRGCRFCQAGMIYRPLRERSVEYLKKLAREMIDSTGYEEISLSSLSSSDYTCLPELVNYLIDEFHRKGINVSLPSLRIDAFALDVMSKVQDIRKSSITFAPEAGTQRLRDVINKGITHEDIIKGSSAAFKCGWNKIKLYFMLGLPTETDADVEGIAILSDEIARAYYQIPKDQRNGRVEVTTSTSFFVPKPFTPFQWAPMASKEAFLEHQQLLHKTVKEMLNARSIKYNWHDPEMSEIEGVLARGDRRLSAVIEDVYRQGALFEPWTDYFKHERWVKAFERAGLKMEFYTTRERSKDELFPWDFIDIGVTRKFLRNEYEKALLGIVTPNCREKCSGCGAYKGKDCPARAGIDTPKGTEA
jgi:radical SAM family uncharacterized protein